MDFLPILVSALQADYLMILLQLGEVDALQIPFENELYDSVKKTTDSLKLDVDFSESNNPNFMIMEFRNEKDQDKFVWSLSFFNQNIRSSCGIPMPNIYDKSGKIRQDLVDGYLKNIKQFFATNYGCDVLIPIQNNADMSDFEQLFCLCNKDEVVGVIIR